MTEQRDLDYFAARAKSERALSEEATDPVVAVIHASMAECYEKLVRDATASRPTHRVIAG